MLSARTWALMRIRTTIFVRSASDEINIRETEIVIHNFIAGKTAQQRIFDAKDWFLLQTNHDKSDSETAI